MDRWYDGPRIFVNESSDLDMLPEGFGEEVAPFELEGYRVFSERAGEKLIFTDLYMVEGDFITSMEWCDRYDFLVNSFEWGKWVKPTKPVVVASRNEAIVATRIMCKLPFSKGAVMFDYREDESIYRIRNDEVFVNG